MQILMQVSSELFVWNWFKRAGNILSVEFACVFTGIHWFCSTLKGVGAISKHI